MSGCQVATVWEYGGDDQVFDEIHDVSTRLRCSSSPRQRANTEPETL